MSESTIVLPIVAFLALAFAWQWHTAATRKAAAGFGPMMRTALIAVALVILFWMVVMK